MNKIAGSVGCALMNVGVYFSHFKCYNKYLTTVPHGYFIPWTSSANSAHFILFLHTEGWESVSTASLLNLTHALPFPGLHCWPVPLPALPFATTLETAHLNLTWITPIGLRENHRISYSSKTPIWVKGEQLQISQPLKVALTHCQAAFLQAAALHVLASA